MSLTKDDLRHIKGIVTETVQGSESRLRQDLTTKINQTEEFLAKTIVQEVDRIDGRIDGVEEKLHLVEGKLHTIDETLQAVEGSQYRLERKVDSMLNTQDDHAVRISRLERKNS